jgi:hypothetical protein
MFNRKGTKMKKTVFCMAAVFLFVAPGLSFGGQEKESGLQQKDRQEGEAFYQEQQKANKEFQQSLVGKSSREAATLIKLHQAAMQAKIKAFEEQARKERRAIYEEKLSQNSKLTEAERKAALARYDERVKEDLARREERQKENKAFLIRINQDKSLTPEQRKAAIDKYFKEQRAQEAERLKKLGAIVGQAPGPSATSGEESH